MNEIKLDNNWLQSNGLYKCPFCEKEFTKNGICTHIYCKHTDIGKVKTKKHLDNLRKNQKINKTAWNKGLTKENSEKIKNISIKLKGKPNIHKGKTWEEIIGAEKYISMKNKWKNNPNMGGIRKGAGRGKKGWYKGFYCYSSWELAFIIYCLDHNINVKQNKDKFKYFWKSNWHTYLPDFIVNNEYIEIKGVKTERDQHKWNQFPRDKILKIYFESDMIFILNYVKEKYGENFISLYNKDFTKEKKKESEYSIKQKEK